MSTRQKLTNFVYVRAALMPQNLSSAAQPLHDTIAEELLWAGCAVAGIRTLGIDQPTGHGAKSVEGAPATARHVNTG